ncbi:MAG: TRAP transporter TatT component family protein, partial [Gammaproteobacteria bacterium]|nr:TRAP transporter TatT component family protein [Gammaproteobacteria bacterium]
MPTRKLQISLVLLVAMFGTGCGGLIATATDRFATNLTAAILEQDDPELVRDGVPSYLLLLDSLILSDPDNAGVLAAGAQLYSAYAVTFTSDPERAKRLSQRGRNYGERALCIKHDPACGWDDKDYDSFVAAL